MENKLEQLLNRLIEKGWKPYGNELYSGAKMNSSTQVGLLIKKDTGYMNIPYTLREVVSKESLLWQFCEENKMLIGFSPRTRTKNAHETYGSILGDIEYWGSDYEYRLIESSLKDESELEDFLLSNIKVEGN